MTPFLTLVLSGFLARFSYQMARSPVLPRFAQDLGASPELIGLIASFSYPPAFGFIAAVMAAVALLFLVTVRDPTPAPAA